MHVYRHQIQDLRIPREVCPHCKEASARYDLEIVIPLRQGELTIYREARPLRQPRQGWQRDQDAIMYDLTIHLTGNNNHDKPFPGNYAAVVDEQVTKREWRIFSRWLRRKTPDELETRASDAIERIIEENTGRCEAVDIYGD